MELAIYLEKKIMSLTLNVSKEAKLFYKSEQKRIGSVEERTIHPSSTIHMKKYSPNPSRSVDDHLFENSDESGDDYPVEGPGRGRDWISHLGENGMKRRRLQPQRENSRVTLARGVSHHPPFRHTLKLRQGKQGAQMNRMEKREYGEMRRQEQKEEPQQQEIRQKHAPRKEGRQTGDIPSRDLHGEANDSDGMGEEVKLDHTSYEDISPTQNSWDADELLDMDEGENHNISENNPFAKQRILKSKYKSKYSG